MVVVACCVSGRYANRGTDGNVAAILRCVPLKHYDPALHAGAKKLAADFAALPSLADAADVLVALAGSAARG